MKKITLAAAIVTRFRDERSCFHFLREIGT
jgi:hypothetical protein